MPKTSTKNIPASEIEAGKADSVSETVTAKVAEAIQEAIEESDETWWQKIKDFVIHYGKLAGGMLANVCKVAFGYV